MARPYRARSFFRMSRSIRSVRFSRRSRPSSSRSSVVSAPGAPRPASISACRTQLRSAVLRQIEFPRHRADGFPALPHDANGLRLKLLRERPPLPFGHDTLLPHFRAIGGVYKIGAGSGLVQLVLSAMLDA